jgi:hypothetical protein
MHILLYEKKETIEFNARKFQYDLLKNATNGINVAQSPIRPSADRQQRQVIAPPKPPNNPPSLPAPPAAARSGGGNGLK